MCSGTNSRKPNYIYIKQSSKANPSRDAKNTDTASQAYNMSSKIISKCKEDSSPSK